MVPSRANLTDGLVSLTYLQFLANRALLSMVPPTLSPGPSGFPTGISPTYTISDDLTFAQAIDVISTNISVTGLHIVTATCSRTASNGSGVPATRWSTATMWNP